MSRVPVGVVDRAAAMRLAFDRSFASAPSACTAAFENLLMLSLGRDPYAIRLTDLAGLFHDVRVMRLPSDVHELLGVASLRGMIVPVYDLGALLDYPSTEAPRWMVLLPGSPRIALAFERFDGHLRRARDSIAETPDSTSTPQHVGEVVRTSDALRRIVHLPSVLQSITERVRHVRPRKDR
jgi:chemotaxis signal transduction protein